MFGHYGDKIGRKNVLVVTLLIMGFATFAIGLLPTYTTIGLWAAVLLVALRFLQGLGLGGEWGGAVLMSLEHGDPAKRGLNASWPQVGVPAGLLLANGVMAVMSAIVRPAGGVHLRAVQHQAALQRCLTRVPDRGRAGRSAGPDHLHRFAGPVRHVGRVSVYVAAMLLITIAAVAAAQETSKIDVHAEKPEERAIIETAA
jgi:Sugar (and other) transporter